MLGAVALHRLAVSVSAVGWQKARALQSDLPAPQVAAAMAATLVAIGVSVYFSRDST